MTTSGELTDPELVLRISAPHPLQVCWGTGESGGCIVSSVVAAIDAAAGTFLPGVAQVCLD